MAKKKIVPVKYTSRDFHSIKKDLVDHAKRYYPNTYKDFNEASFGSLMLDTVAYVGDMLSFYLDYSVNESFLETSIQYENVLNHANQMGYKFRNSPSSTGTCQFYVTVPSSNITGGPNSNYFPVLLAGTLVQSTNGTVFTLIENVSFESAGYGDREVYSRGPDGVVTFYLLRAEGQVVSGELVEQEVKVGDFERFLKVTILGSDIGKIVSVHDTDGKQYYEVDYLSQNIVYRAIPNLGDNIETVPAIFKPYAVPRRFIVEEKRDRVILQFGYGSEDELKNKSLVDPADIALQMDGRTYVTDSSFDPIKITKTDKFGVAPADTTLIVKYRRNTNDNVNVGAGQVTEIMKPIIRFKNQTSLDFDIRQHIASNIEVDNPDPIVGDITIPTTEEIKRRALDTYAMQNRAVTIQDYKAAIYTMPSHFGAIKRCAVHRDVDSARRNLNVFVVSEDANGKLIASNSTLKNNLRNYLNNIKMINDTMDILDATVINIGIEFEVRVEREVNKLDISIECVNEIVEELDIPKEIGEPFSITDITRVLKNIDGVHDVLSIKLVNKVGGVYSNQEHSISGNLPEGGTYLSVPEDAILEVKYPYTDIVGTIK